MSQYITFRFVFYGYEKSYCNEMGVGSSYYFAAAVDYYHFGRNNSDTTTNYLYNHSIGCNTCIACYDSTSYWVWSIPNLRDALNDIISIKTFPHER